MLNPKATIIRSEKHRRWIASLPCAVSGLEGSTQAAHIRLGTTCGLGMKPSDEFVIPLSVEMHARQHRLGERIFYPDVNAAIELAQNLYAVTGDDEAGQKLVREFRERWF